jgi:3-phenylpropionate/trans-cinnamate dioxygenase ferredoxin subunit
MTDAVRIAGLEELPEGQGVRVEIGSQRIAVFRRGDEVYAIGDRCSHAEASLAEGDLFGLEVECPRHGSEFSLETGKPVSFPATRPVPVYPTTVVAGEVFVDVSDDDPAVTR